MIFKIISYFAESMIILFRLYASPMINSMVYSTTEITASFGTLFLNCLSTIC